MPARASAVEAQPSGSSAKPRLILPSMRHYLLLRTDARPAIHHGRGEDRVIATAIVAEGRLRLDLPGIAIAFWIVLA